MLQNPCKTFGFKKNMVYKIPPGGGGEVNHIQPVAYYEIFRIDVGKGCINTVIHFYTIGTRTINESYDSMTFSHLSTEQKQNMTYPELLSLWHHHLQL